MFPSFPDVQLFDLLKTPSVCTHKSLKWTKSTSFFRAVLGGASYAWRLKCWLIVFPCFPMKIAYILYNFQGSSRISTWFTLHHENDRFPNGMVGWLNRFPKNDSPCPKKLGNSAFFLTCYRLLSQQCEASKIAFSWCITPISLWFMVRTNNYGLWYLYVYTMTHQNHENGRFFLQPIFFRFVIWKPGFQHLMGISWYIHLLLSYHIPSFLSPLLGSTSWKCTW